MAWTRYQEVDLSWQENAACLGESVDLFFDPATERKALRICARCPVQEECLEESLRVYPLAFFGVAGGMTAEERKKFHNNQRKKAS